MSKIQPEAFPWLQYVSDPVQTQFSSAVLEKNMLWQGIQMENKAKI